MVYAWALEQSADSKLRFPAQNCLVPWHVRHSCDGSSRGGGEMEGEGEQEGAAPQSGPESDGVQLLHRFCHVFRRGELEELVAGAAAELELEAAPPPETATPGTEPADREGRAVE